MPHRFASACSMQPNPAAHVNSWEKPATQIGIAFLRLQSHLSLREILPLKEPGLPIFLPMSQPLLCDDNS